MSIPAANTLMSHEVILVKIIVIIDRHRITTGDVAILEFLELHQVHRVAEQAWCECRGSLGIRMMGLRCQKKPCSTSTPCGSCCWRWGALSETNGPG